jgi:hypothetical protein
MSAVARWPTSRPSSSTLAGVMRAAVWVFLHLGETLEAAFFEVHDLAGGRLRVPDLTPGAPFVGDRQQAELQREPRPRVLQV